MMLKKCRNKDFSLVFRPAQILFALVLAFYVNYVPFHLLIEAHSDGAGHSHSSHHADHDSHHDSEDNHSQHEPHPASDHRIELRTKSEPPVFFFPAFIAISEILIATPEALPEAPFAERVKHTGESPPGPSRPRAPPTV